LVKPPSVGELDARVRVLLRKQSAQEDRGQELTDLSVPLGI
jgi:DNA-binding response OmpR family regulator